MDVIPSPVASNAYHNRFEVRVFSYLFSSRDQPGLEWCRKPQERIQLLRRLEGSRAWLKSEWPRQGLKVGFRKSWVSNQNPKAHPALLIERSWIRILVLQRIEIARAGHHLFLTQSNPRLLILARCLTWRRCCPRAFAIRPCSNRRRAERLMMVWRSDFSTLCIRRAD